jgi:heme exporter protein A
MPEASPPAVEAKNLSRTFSGSRAVDGVSFVLEAGDALALFGPNGAGKTTLLRLLAGLLKPTHGEARIAGTAARGDAAVRSRIGLISHQTMLYGAMTARENVALAATLHGLRDPRGAALRALDALEIGGRADSVVRALSRGLQQRVSIARAIVHDPALVLLDEPYTGLDAVGAQALTTMLSGLRARGAALVLVTHNIAEGLALATRAGVMVRGRLVSDEPASGLDVAAFGAAYHARVTADVVRRSA